MSTEDQGRNESERTHAAIGNALCDGGLLLWNYHEALTEKDIDNVSLEEFKEEIDKIQNKRMGTVSRGNTHNRVVLCFSY